MSVFDSITQRARGLNQRIVLSEGEDPRIVEGAVRAFNDGLAVPVLVGRRLRVVLDMPWLIGSRRPRFWPGLRMIFRVVAMPTMCIN